MGHFVQFPGELSRAESARRVLEARRGKKKNDTPNAATPGMSSHLKTRAGEIFLI